MGLQSSSHFQSAAVRHRQFVTGWLVIVLLAVVSLPRLFWKRPGSIQTILGVGNEAINTSSSHPENCWLSEYVINYSGFKNLTL